ncbi:recQ-mediated genome instability protein 1 isoform X2 [Nymphaea colorata]|uniref:recQ-mediated genome instability protein 1 isoform X2 n=1 Tax=Nymphaea colorata TaxID=210225 RepID=UPI00129DA832|nr:recQ-mediated genome instability protein 1 isoform X2 [Nymphaea colorata]
MARLRLPSSSDEEEDSGGGVRNRASSSRNPDGARVDQRKDARASRRLQILDSPYGEEEEEARGGPPVDPPAPPAAAAATEDHTVEISDDDEFIDVPDFFTPPSSSPPRAQDDLGGASSGMPPESAVLEEESGDSPVAGLLRGIGARPRREWLDSCIRRLADARPGFARLSVREQADLCLKQYLFADFNLAGAGVLPPNIHTMHAVEIGGPFILQVDEIVNVGSPLRDRYKEAPASNKRCLKLSMTDGIQHVFGIEYRPIKDLKVLAPAGLKVAVQNVHVRRGLLMLVAEVLEVLGGSVEYLDAARRRLVDEVNKPPRGRRRPRGEVVSSLVERARLAAWPPSMLDDLADLSSSEHLNLRTPTSNQADLSSFPTGDNQERGSEAFTSRSVTENIISNHLPNARTSVDGSMDHEIDQVNVRHGNEEEVHLAKRAHLSTSHRVEFEGSSISDAVASEHPDTVPSSHQGSMVIGGNDEQMVTDESSARRVSWDGVSETSPDVISTEVGAHAVNETSQSQMRRRLQVSGYLSKQANLPAQSADSSNLSRPSEDPIQDPLRLQHACALHLDQESAPARTLAKGRIADKLALRRLTGDKCNKPSKTVIGLEGTIAEAAGSTLDLNEHSGSSSKVKSRIAVAEFKSTLGPPVRVQSADEVDHPYILSGEQEMPFTYMACLQAKHAVKKAHGNAEESTLSTRGNIKCFLTGVKGFQFKGRSQFELRVYVDDGSLISEVLIDHRVVQNGIGYSAAEVTAGLSSPDKDKVSKMREVMKTFQAFLANFEGIMLMEINDTTSVPVALEMNQGCLSSDAWMLLQRLKLYTASRSAQYRPTPINISP